MVALMTPTVLRKGLLAAGYLPTPVIGKAPVQGGWQTKTDLIDAEIVGWTRQYPNAKSTGLLTRAMPTLDIDILDKKASEAVEALVRDRYEVKGKILTRFGLAPKRAIPFQTDKPFKKITANLIAPDGSKGQKLELLGDGQQVVAFGIHEDTKKPYTWNGGEPGKIKYEKLPPITEAEARQLIDDAVTLLCEKFGYQRPSKKVNGDGTASEDWRSLLANIYAGHELHDSIRDLAAK